MTSSRRSRIVALAVVVAALATAGPAGAAPHGNGVSGYVIDADTGIVLPQSKVTWHGAATPPPEATTDTTGRYLFAGLEPGETGSLDVVGPPGYDHLALGGLTVPADGFLNQNVEVHRDWASISSGGYGATNDDSGSAAGCAAGHALDSDRTTSWSASASRPANDPPSLTVQLPQTITVSGFTLDAGASCGHPAGAALGRYRIETSPDGTTWAPAAEGELGTAQREVVTPITPTGNTTGVRFVRLTALGPQDPAATTIDVRELQVFGTGPNQPPSGTLKADADRNYIGGVVTLRATFGDPDSAIVRYLWDFDGDGNWDQATGGPTVSHVWAGPGTYHVTVGARDFQGALGTASIDLRVTDPNAPLEPVIQRKPLITFGVPDGIDLETRIACASKCTFKASMTLSKRMARKLHLKRRTILKMTRKTEGAGLGSWTIELPQSVIKRLRKAHLRKVNVLITASAVDHEKRHSTVHRWFTFR